MSGIRLRLLVVGVEPARLDSLAQDLLEAHDVERVATAGEALVSLAKRGVDILLVDETGGGPRSGFELASRARGLCPAISTVLVTGVRDPDLLCAGLADRSIYRCLLAPAAGPVDDGAVRSALRAAVDAQVAAREREADTTRIKSRLDAMVTLGDLASLPEDRSVGEILEELLGKLPRVVPYDIAVAVLELGDLPQPTVMRVQCQVAVDPDELALVRDRASTLYATLASRPLADSAMLVTVGGVPPAAVPPRRARGTSAHVPIVVEGRAIGLLQLHAFRDRPYSIDEEQLLYMVAARVSALAQRRSRGLLEERRKLAQMVEAMADGVVLVDDTDEVVLINPAARRMLDIPNDVAVTRSYLKSARGFYPFDLLRSAATDTTVVLEDVTIRDRHLQSSVSTVRGLKGRPSGAVVVLRDLTADQALVRRKQDFATQISHELRTPLTSITGALDIVLDIHGQDLTAAVRRYSEMARSECGRLNHIVNELIEGSREEQRTPLELKPVDLDALARDATERFRHTASARRVTMSYRAPSDLPKHPRILCDPARVAQVIGNLLSNALTFCPEGGNVDVEVFHPEATSSYVGLSVWNDGAAIPASERERIFDEFDPTQGGQARRVGGSAFGLSVSRSIVESHGGRIWVEPTARGAKFVITLPVVPEDAEPEVPARSGDPTADTAAHGDQLVLVVDDDVPTSYVLKGMLLAAGYQVAVAHDAEDALGQARSQRPHLMTLDLRMPGIDGLALIEILRHDPETRDTPVVVVSIAPDRDRVTAGGADACLGKPIDRVALLETVSRLLSEGRGRRNKVLIVDDEPSIRMVCRAVLESADYEVHEAPDGEEGVACAKRVHPDLILLDLMMPKMDGCDAARALRADATLALTPLIFISARGQTADKVRAFKLGADDYLVKPFDAAELLARVEKALERREREIGASPTTRLPGSAQIEHEITARLSSDAPERYAFCYLDLDNLKAFNDYYGYAKADGMIRQIGDLIRESVARTGTPGDFIGHIAGDDFVFITTVDRVDQMCIEICESFDRLAPLYYNRADRERGYIETTDRYGQMRRFPLMSVSIAALTSRVSRIASYSDLAARGAVAKQRAKALPGSSYVRDDSVLLPAQTARVSIS
jgi:CheY-like chemotaxis protein/GGDEF domain-containing protein